MLFNSYPYIVFLTIVVFTFLVLETSLPKIKSIFLLLMSYGFYAWWRLDFVALLVISTAVNYGLGGAIARRAETNNGGELLVFGLAFNLGLIAVFKYAGLFVNTADDLFGLNYPIPHLFLPLAISFFTFEQISYLVDVSRGGGDMRSSIMPCSSPISHI